MKSSLTKNKLKLLAKDLSNKWPSISARDIAKKHGFSLQYLGTGLHRQAHLIEGTNIVLKLSQKVGQSSRELKRISEMKKKIKFKEHMPEVYRNGCILSWRKSSVVAMEYCPEPATIKEVEHMEEVFRGILRDVHSGNVRKTKHNTIKIIDLGY